MGVLVAAFQKLEELIIHGTLVEEGERASRADPPCGPRGPPPRDALGVVVALRMAKQTMQNSRQTRDVHRKKGATVSEIKQHHKLATCIEISVRTTHTHTHTRTFAYARKRATAFKAKRQSVRKQCDIVRLDSINQSCAPRQDILLVWTKHKQQKGQQPTDQCCCMHTARRPAPNFKASPDAPGNMKKENSICVLNIINDSSLTQTRLNGCPRRCLPKARGAHHPWHARGEPFGHLHAKYMVQVAIVFNLPFCQTFLRVGVAAA